jgi:hypothetical protein
MTSYVSKLVIIFPGYEPWRGCGSLRRVSIKEPGFLQKSGGICPKSNYVNKMCPGLE